ncbi:MAG: tape measure protein [Bacillota bacterium]
MAGPGRNKQITIFVGADTTGLVRDLDKVQRKLERGFGSDAMGMSRMANGLFAGFTAAMGAAGIASIKLASDYQVNEKAFSHMPGSAEKGKAFLAQLAQFAAQTPFELTGLMESSKKLLAFKFQAQDIIPMMSAIGDAMAMMGAGEEGIERTTRALGQMQAVFSTRVGVFPSTLICSIFKLINQYRLGGLDVDKPMNKAVL